MPPEYRSQAELLARRLIGSNGTIERLSSTKNRVFRISGPERGGFYLKFFVGSGMKERCAMERRILTYLAEVLVPCPHLVDVAVSELSGESFLVSTAIKGDPLRTRERMQQTISVSDAEQLGRILSRIHAGLRSSLAGCPHGMVESSLARSRFEDKPTYVMLSRLANSFSYSEQDLTRAFFAALKMISKLKSNFIHADFQDKNILRSGSQGFFVCDFEDARWGYLETDLLLENIFCYKVFGPRERERLQEALITGYGSGMEHLLDPHVSAAMRLVKLAGGIFWWIHQGEKELAGTDYERVAKRRFADVMSETLPYMLEHE